MKYIFYIVYALLYIGISTAQASIIEEIKINGSDVTATSYMGSRGLDVNCISGCSGSGGGGTVAQGAPNTAANAWPFYLTDTLNSLSKLFDLDTSGVTHEYNLGVTIRLPGSGGSVVGGTSSNPLRIDPTGSTTQPISGTVAVSNFPGTQTVSGTVTANAGTGTFTVDASGHTVPVSGTFWQTTQPVSGTLTVLQGTSPWVTSGGGGGGGDVNLFDNAGNPINSTGTSLNVDVTNTVPVTGTFWQATQPVSGTVTANAGTNLNTSSLNLEATQSGFKSANHTDLGAINTTLGTPFQSGGSIGNTAFTANAGTNLNTSALALDASVGTTNTRLSTINTTLGSPFQAGGSIGNTSFVANAGTNLNTSLLALDTSVNGVLLAQGSTTSGQTGPLNQTATTTAAPTYTTAKTNPLSTDTSGNLRVSLKDSPANTNKFLVTADPVTFASPQHVINDANTAVIGHVIADSGSTTAVTGNVTVVQPTGSNLHVAVDSMPTTTVTGTVAATQSGTWTVQPGNTANTTAWKVDGSSVTQPVSGTVTANAGTNLNTSSLNLETTQSGFKSANHTDLGAINTTLGTPFQAGGSVANTSFGATQATAANLNATVVGPSGVALAKDSSLSTINTTLGSPFQAGGSIGNTSFIGTLSDTTQSSSRTTDGNVDFECTNLNAMRFFVTVTTGQQCGFYAKAASAGVFSPALFFDEQQLVSNGQIDGSGFSTSGFYDVSCGGYKTVEFQCTGATALHPITFDFRANPSASSNVNVMGGYIQQVADITGAISLPTNAAQETGGNLASIVTHEASIDTKVATATLQTSGNSSLSTIATNTGTIATNTTGVSTSALQTTANTKLDTIATDVVATQVAQASTTSGQNGNLVQMATITAHPTHVTTKTNALSGDVNGNLRVTLADSTMPTTPVTGTFFQATQPVSGTFFQTTQPVSIASLPALTAGSAVIGHVITDTGSVTNATLSAETTKVIGTVNVAASQAIGLAAGSAVIGHVINDASSAVIGHVIVDTAPTTAVTGTFFQATQPVSIATAPVLVAGSAIIGKVGIDQTTPGTTNLVALAANQTVNVAQINGVTPLMGNGVTGTGSQRVTIASDNTAFSVNDVPPALTKGTQGSTGFSVQELKDAGRTQFRFYATAVASGTTTTETIFTLTKSSGTAATATATTFTPTSGKKWRITSIEGASRGNATATAQVTTFNVRVNTAGACIVSSTPIIYSFRTATPATALAYDRFAIQGMEGDEITGDGTLQWCLTANSVFTTNAPTWDVLITGYEY